MNRSRLTKSAAIFLVVGGVLLAGPDPVTVRAEDQPAGPRLAAIEVATADIFFPTAEIVPPAFAPPGDVASADEIALPAIDPDAGVAPATEAPAEVATKDAAVVPAVEAVTATGEQETPPEALQKPPELVGPDDDLLLKEVEQHVNIAPPEAGIRLAEPAYDIPLELNAKVLDYVEVFQTSRRRNFEEGLIRSRKYETLMKPIFRELGIPTDLYYLALIESAYKPKAYSYAQAAGIWQFIASTGRLYGLRRSEYQDERFDPEKSTRAAAQHLKDLYDEFGSWPLVFAAYNAGPGRVRRDIAKAGTSDFWSLPLPAQTRNYVPAFYAALIIAKEPERYGFHVEFEELPASEVVEVQGGTRLSLVAAVCGASLDTIRELNPELRRTSCPPGGSYRLRIPGGTSGRLFAGLAKVPKGKATAGWSAYRVAPGDTLFSIAQRFGTTIEAISAANRLKGSAIHPGDQLTIPGQRTASGSIPRAPGRVVVSSAATPEVYHVKRGDNPWSVARRFGVALADLLDWNGMDGDSVLKVGQRLALREPDAGARSAESASANRTYEVRRGDSLWMISRKFDASVDAIRQANGFSPGHRLQIGDRIILPDM